MNRLFYAYFFILPFTLLVDHILGINVAGISIMNALYLGFYLLGVLWFFLARVISGNLALRGAEWILIGIGSLFYAVLALKLIRVGSIDEAVGWLIDNQYYVSMLCVVCIASIVRLHFKTLSGIMLVSSSLVGTLGLYSFMTSNYFGLMPYDLQLSYAIPTIGKIRLSAIFNNPNVAAYYFVVMALFSYLFLGKLKAYWSNRIIYGHWLLMGLCILCTFSKSAYIIVFTIFLMETLFMLHRRGLQSFMKWGILGLVIVVGVAAYISTSNVYMFSKESIVHNPRIAKWLVGYELYRDYPMLGMGLTESFTIDEYKENEAFESTFSDNEFIKSFIWFGAIGGFTLLALFLHLVTLGYAVSKRPPPGANRYCLIFISIALAVGGFFNNIFEIFPFNVYIVMLIVIVLRMDGGSFNDGASRIVHN
jgi:hypothetical protein